MLQKHKYYNFLSVILLSITSLHAAEYEYYISCKCICTHESWRESEEAKDIHTW